MEVLLETNRRLQHAKSIEEIIVEGMSQIVKLVEKPVQFFEINNQVIKNHLSFVLKQCLIVKIKK